MKKAFAIGNLVVVIGVIFWNYFTNTKGINGNTVGDLSAQYANLFTPASYAFSIWGLIFLSLLGHCIFQIRSAFSKGNNDFLLQIGPWLIIANLANALWVWFWLTENTGLTIGIMLLILLSLMILVFRLNIPQSSASSSYRLWVEWPIELYGGWITVATVANISAYLAKIGWQAVFSEVTWAAIMIVVATLVNLAVLLTRQMKVFVGVGCWALFAIAIRHWNQIPLLQWTALACVLLLAAFLFVPGASKAFSGKR